MAQTDKEPESNSINSGLEPQNQPGLGLKYNPTKSSVPQPEKNSTDISMPRCLQVPQVAKNVGSLYFNDTIELDAVIPTKLQ